MKYLPFILFTVLTNAAAQLMLKQGMSTLVSPMSENIILKLLQVVFNPWVFAGLVTFVISMASHLFVLSKVELSFAYPFLSLAYVAWPSLPISSSGGHQFLAHCRDRLHLRRHGADRPVGGDLLRCGDRTCPCL